MEISDLISIKENIKICLSDSYFCFLILGYVCYFSLIQVEATS